MGTPITQQAGAIIDGTPNPAINAPLSAPVSRLANFASLKPETSYQSVSHYTVQRVVDLAANIEGRDLGGTVADIKKAIDKITG